MLGQGAVVVVIVTSPEVESRACRSKLLAVELP